jgi:hypothetical protein
MGRQFKFVVIVLNIASVFLNDLVRDKNVVISLYLITQPQVFDVCKFYTCSEKSRTPTKEWGSWPKLLFIKSHKSAY